MTGWRYVSAGEAQGTNIIASGIYDANDRVRLLVLKTADDTHEGLNSFGRLIADLLNTHDRAVKAKAIADYDACWRSPWLR